MKDKENMKNHRITRRLTIDTDPPIPEPIPVRQVGETNYSHCDLFWAKALRQEATRHTCEVGAEVGW
jgi:hypothetical protein